MEGKIPFILHGQYLFLFFAWQKNDALLYNAPTNIPDVFIHIVRCGAWDKIIKKIA